MANEKPDSVCMKDAKVVIDAPGTHAADLAARNAKKTCDQSDVPAIADLAARAAMSDGVNGHRLSLLQGVREAAEKRKATLPEKVPVAPKAGDPSTSLPPIQPPSATPPVIVKPIDPKDMCLNQKRTVPGCGV